MSDTPKTEAATEQTPKVEAEQTVAVENDDTAQEKSTEGAATPVTTPEVTDVERARIAAADKQAIVNQYHALRTTLEAVGIDLDDVPEATATDATENTETVENSENGVASGIEREELVTLINDAVTTAVAPLQKTVGAQADYIAALEKLPAGKVPAMAVVRDEPENAETADPMKDMTQEQKTRYALDQMYGDKA